MEDIFYDTSWTLYKLPQSTPSFDELLLPPSATPQAQEQDHTLFASHADAFSRFLNRGKPRYVREEEQETLGGLRQCSWMRLDDLSNASAPAETRQRTFSDDDDSEVEPGDPVPHGLVVLLVYEKKSYKFIFHNRMLLKHSPLSGISVPRPNLQSTKTPILFAKSSSTALKALTAYLSNAFSLTSICPLRLPPAFIQKTLEDYLTWFYKYFFDDDLEHRSRFIAMLGPTKLVLAFDGPVAPDLKTLEISISPTTILKLFALPGIGNQNWKLNADQRYAELQADLPYPSKVHLLKWVAECIKDRTGLSIPMLESLNKTLAIENRISMQDVEQQEDHIATPLAITRVTTAPLFLSADGRLKLNSKPANQSMPWYVEENLRFANEELLFWIVEEADRQAREEEEREEEDRSHIQTDSEPSRN